MSTDLSLLISLYNRETEFESSIPKVYEFIHDKNLPFEIILYDDGSTDSTFDLMQQFAKTHDNIVLLKGRSNAGRGFAIKEMVKISSGKHLIYLDSDLSLTSPLEIICKINASLNHYPIVIGNRFLKEAKLKRKPLRKVFGIGYRFLLQFFFPNLKERDVEVGLKGFRKETLLKLANRAKENRWSFDLEILHLATLERLPIHELAYDWNETYDGYVSSVNLLQDSLDQFIGFFRILKNHRATKHH